MERYPIPHGREDSMFSYLMTADEAPAEKRRRLESADSTGAHSSTTAFGAKTNLPPALIPDPFAVAYDPYGPPINRDFRSPWKKDSFRALLEDYDFGDSHTDKTFDVLQSIPLAGGAPVPSATREYNESPYGSYGQVTSESSLLCNESVAEIQSSAHLTGTTTGYTTSNYGKDMFHKERNATTNTSNRQLSFSVDSVKPDLLPVKPDTTSFIPCSASSYVNSETVEARPSSYKTSSTPVLTGSRPEQTGSSSVKASSMPAKTSSSPFTTSSSPVTTSSPLFKTSCSSVKTSSLPVKTGLTTSNSSSPVQATPPPYQTSSSTMKTSSSTMKTSSSIIKTSTSTIKTSSLPAKTGLTPSANQSAPPPLKPVSSPVKAGSPPELKENNAETKTTTKPVVKVKQEDAASSSIGSEECQKDANKEKDSADDMQGKENAASDVVDPFDGLDWKDGIATLPGSNLRFRKTEFGTLEIVSTVETDKGDSVEWSTATDHGKSSKDEETASPSSDLMNGPPGADNVLCCEVCGVYGLPQDFCASGRFCSLSCVGAHTGRRNKGREFIRNIAVLEGKVVSKKKKKGKGRKLDDDDPPYGEPISPKSPKLKGVKPERGRGKPKVPMAEAKGTCLTGNMVPYNFSKPFTWADYLYTSSAKPVPISTFKQENPDVEVFALPCDEFKKNMRLEAIDPKHPSYICVCTIVRVKGARLRLHFDGWSECYDFWTNADSPFLYPVGWCAKNGQVLHPNRGVRPESFNWDKYLKKNSAIAAPEHLFKPVSQTRHGFKVGMKLEAIDRKNPDLICVATVTKVIGNRFLVHFDEWDDTYDYWCEEDCPYIHPVGWCAENGKKLNPPNDDEVDTFTWEEYLATTGAEAAPPDLFKKRTLPAFKPYQKLEAVDKRNPSLIRCTTVAEVQGYRMAVHFDGWDDIYDDWFDADSTELHPVGYCERTGHPLEPPLTTADKISSVACPTPGCKGIGHVKGAKYSSHHSTFGCPYSLQNLNKDSCLVDRLSPNSMTEESDWSYASKNKTGSVGGLKRGEIMDGVCPTPGCDGSGHISGHWRTHQSAAGCPRNEANIQKMPKPVILPSPGKSSITTYPEIKPKPSPVSVKAIPLQTSTATKTTTYNAAPVAKPSRRPSRDRREKVEKVVTDRLFDVVPDPNHKLQEKAVQHIADVYQPWKNPPAGNGFCGNRHPGSHGNAKRSRERLRMSKWSVDDVVKHVTKLGCPEQAKIFAEQKIDGEALLLLNQNDIVHIMKIKLGPALKIYKSIPRT